MPFIVKRESCGTYFVGMNTGAPMFDGDRERAQRFESREEYEQQLARFPGLAGELEEVEQ
jgi:outer membrane protein TolC